LKKNLIKVGDTTTNNSSQLEKMKFFDVLLVGEGALCGLEAVTNTKKYQYSLFCESEYTIFFRLPLDKLYELGDKIIDYLKDEYKIFKEKMKKQMENYFEYKKKYRIYYHENYIDKEIRNEKYIADDERKISEGIKDTLKDIKKNQVERFRNDFTQYNLIKQSISSRNLKHSTLIPKFDNAILRNPYADKLRLKLFALTKIDERAGGGSNTDRSSSTTFNRLKTTLFKTMTKKQTMAKDLSRTKSIERTMTSVGFKRIAVNNTEPDSRLATLNNDDCTISQDVLPIKSKTTNIQALSKKTLGNELDNNSRLATNYDYTISHDILPTTSRTNVEGTLSKKNIITPTEGRISKKDSQDSFRVYRTISEMRTNLDIFSKEKKMKIKLTLGKRIVNNLKDWKKVQKKDNTANFDTGCFNIPLISNILNK
jgi:hypothetical protein